MRLRQYLAEHKIDYGIFAKEVGVTSEAVRLWADDQRMPRHDNLVAIREATNGAVTANDFCAEPAVAPEPEAV